jgi:DNA replication protein DnaC
MDDALAKTLKSLRLYGLHAHWDEYLALARKEHFSPVRLLQHAVEEEHKIKQQNARERRLVQARIPERLVIETYPFVRQPNLDKKKLTSLYDAFDYVEKSRNMIWLGIPGCGKTGLATSFLIQAIQRGYTGRYILFAELVEELYASVADHSEHKVLKRYLSYDVLLIDEVGYVEVEPVQVGLFFTQMHKRHRKRSTLITSNLGFTPAAPPGCPASATPRPAAAPERG